MENKKLIEELMLSATQNPKFQQPVETVENFKNFVQLKQNKLF